MDEKNISKSTFQWIFFLFILLIFIIFLSTRLLGARKVEQQRQPAEPTLEKEAVAPEAEDEPKPEAKDSPKFQQKP